MRPDRHLDEAVDWLLQRQAPEGWWVGELETNVTMTAEHVLLLRFLGREDDLERIRAGAIRHILGAQRHDGSWALYYDAPADLSTTIEAYTALRVLGVEAGAEPLCRALDVVLSLGGLARARVFTKIWLALFGRYPWEGVPSMPAELVAFPTWAPLNLYDFACWARGTIAPLLIVISRRPRRELGVTLDELVVPGTERQLRRVPGSGPFWWLDQLLKLYDRLPAQPGRGRARRRLVDWIVAHQEADGSWGGIQPPWVYSLIALDLEGGAEPAIRAGLAGVERFSVEDEGGWRFQACMSPVWDTAWVVRALARVEGDAVRAANCRAVDWLLQEQITGGGDWQVRCRDVPCGGWAFEFDNDGYPDIDDTAVIVTAFVEAGVQERAAAAIDLAARWVRAMRSDNGGWGAFDRNNTSTIAYRLPFADFGAMIDPPSEDVTAHVLEMLAALGRPLDDPDVASAVRYLARTQRPTGSWYGRWGVNHLYGTWCAVTALVPAGARPDLVEAGARWVLGRQNEDGGWGETCHSYADESFAGVGKSTASQTAWAILTLQAAGLGDDAACQRGLGYLRERQRGGTWDEPEFTGTGFPRDFYINYHLYRHVFPTMALAQAARHP